MKKILVSLISFIAFFITPSVSFAGISSLNGLSAKDQTFTIGTAPNSPHLLIQSSGSTHTFNWDSTPWLLNQGGTGATTFTTGSIPFIFGGVFSENNTNLFWDNISHALGIGNSNPQHALDVSGALYSRLVTVSPSSSVTIDWNAGNVQTLTLSSNSILTFSNGQAGGEYKSNIKQDATGGRTVTWPTSVKWPGGSTPILTTTANGIDMINFVNTGGDYLGSFTLNYQASPSSTIAFDTSGQGITTCSSGSATPITLTLSEANEYVVVQTVDTSSGSDTITAVSIGGVSATKLQGASPPSFGNYVNTWGASIPTSGSKNIVTTCSTDADSIRAVAGAYKQAALDTSHQTTSSLTSPLSDTITTTTNSEWVVSFAVAGAGTTQASTNVSSVRQAGYFTGWQIGDTNAAVNGTSGYTMTWTNTVSQLDMVTNIALEAL